MQVYNESQLDLDERGKGAFHQTGAQGRILVQGYLKYVQVYNKSRLDLVEGRRELIIRRAEPVDRGEYLCKVISSTDQFSGV